MQECQKCGTHYEAPDEIYLCKDCTGELWEELEKQRIN